MIRKLRIKFVIVSMTIVTLMLFLLFGSIYMLTKRELEKESLRMMSMIDERPGMPRPAPMEVPQQIQQIPPESIRLPFFSLITDSDGSIRSVFGGYYDLSDETALQEMADRVIASGKENGVLRGYNLRYLRMPMGETNRIVFADISSEKATLSGLLKTCILLGLPAFFVFLVLTYFLARWAVRPVEKAWDDQRRFVADASHELKTPLTVILTNTEMMKSNDFDASQKEELLDGISSMATQMRGLTEGLLDLARVDFGTQKAELTSVDFSDLVQDTCLIYEPAAYEKGYTLDSEVAGGLFVKGNASYLKQLPEILLDNALKYAAAGSRIRVLLEARGRQLVMTVANQGAPIAQEDLKNIFKRFYRADEARSMNGSYGLGLSIASEIIKEHKGKIQAESSGGWNTFSVRLPLSG